MASKLRWRDPEQLRETVETSLLELIKAVDDLGIPSSRKTNRLKRADDHGAQRCPSAR